MNYNQDQVNRILTSINMPSADDDLAGELYAQTLVSWISSLRTNTNKSPHVVIGIKAVETLASTDWFPKCFDLKKPLTSFCAEHQSGTADSFNWWGSIFGAQVFVPTEEQAKEYKLPLDVLFVISADGRAAVSQRLENK